MNYYCSKAGAEGMLKLDYYEASFFYIISEWAWHGDTGLERLQRQAELCEFEAGLASISSFIVRSCLKRQKQTFQNDGAFCLHSRMCTVDMPGAWGSQDRALSPLEFQIVVSHHMGAGNQTQVHCKSNKCSKLLSHLFSPSARGFWVLFVCFFFFFLFFFS